MEERPWSPGARRAEHGDLDALVEQAPLVGRHHALAPTFSGISPEEDEAELRAMIVEDISNDELGELVYERDGRVIAGFEIVPVEKASMHRGLAQPDDAACLGWAASLPRRPRLGRRPRSDRRSVRLGARAWLQVAGHRLARDEPAVVSLLARTRVPPLLPAAVPLDPLARR